MAAPEPPEGAMPSNAPTSSVSSASSGWTMKSDSRSELCVSECGGSEAERIVEREVGAWDTPSAAAVAMRALQLIVGAPGGSCIVLAPDKELQKLAPHAHVSDGGGMTHRLKSVHVSSPEFEALFFEFAEHSATDRWPADHEDELLRGRPKDGVGVLLSPSGFRVKCAVRLEGLPQASRSWSCMGMRHNAALAATDLMHRAIVYVRSEGGMVHLLAKDVQRGLVAYCVSDEGPCDTPCDPCEAEHNDDGRFGYMRNMSQAAVLDESTGSDIEQQVGKLVVARQELEDTLARLRLESTERSGPGLEVASALHDLGVACREGGDIVTARQHIEESLAIRQRIHGKSPSLEVATSLHELALVFRELRHLRTASRFLQQSLEMKQAVCGDQDGAEVADTLRELAAVCVERRRLRTAKHHLENVLRAEECGAEGGADAAVHARTLRELGVLELKSGNFQSARVHLQHALRFHRELSGETPDADVARTMYALGLVALRSGDHSAARSHLEESLNVFRAIHGDTPHQDVHKVLRLLAAVNVRDSKSSGWRDYSRKSVDMHRAIHHTTGISALPARLDMMGLVLVERTLTVKSHLASIDNFMAGASSASSAWKTMFRGGAGAGSGSRRGSGSTADGAAERPALEGRDGVTRSASAPRPGGAAADAEQAETRFAPPTRSVDAYLATRRNA